MGGLENMKNDDDEVKKEKSRGGKRDLWSPPSTRKLTLPFTQNENMWGNDGGFVMMSAES